MDNGRLHAILVELGIVAILAPDNNAKRVRRHALRLARRSHFRYPALGHIIQARKADQVVLEALSQIEGD